MFQMFGRESLGRHRVQHFYVVNTNLYQSHAMHFPPTLTVSEILRFEMFGLENLGPGQTPGIMRIVVYRSDSLDVSNGDTVAQLGKRIESPG